MLPLVLVITLKIWPVRHTSGSYRDDGEATMTYAVSGVRPSKKTFPEGSLSRHDGGAW